MQEEETKNENQSEKESQCNSPIKKESKAKNANKKIKNDTFHKNYLISKTRGEKTEKIIAQKEKELKEICTFKPSINSNFKLREWEKRTNSKANRSNSTETKPLHNNVLERMNFYLEKSKQKKAFQAEKEEFKEKEELTFRPCIIREVPEYEEHNIKGIQMFLERQMKSQQLKNEKNNLLNPNYNKKYDKLYKNKQSKACSKNFTNKNYKAAIDILHSELLSEQK